ncbi:hypothetical protein [Methylocystis heyeri]|uniref:Uncharacterized protein n=1 Tax=Methylocystis heyeri TaxID=391905 RepID=A0A6B8KJE8_9HYPH|nr:hypothetical protein [Methylocystis heyeri]QGM47181.1 hypothetical protein H2LOC_016595 [Methylocystis heyeri]
MKLSAAAALAALLALAGGAGAQEDNMPSCNPSSGRGAARIDCLNRITRALNDRIGALEAQLTKFQQNQQSSDNAQYLRRSDLDGALNNALSGYVKYNAPIAINVQSEPSTNQSNGSCLAADMVQEGVVIDKPCSFDSKSEMRWQLLPAMKTSAFNR